MKTPRDLFPNDYSNFEILTKAIEKAIAGGWHWWTLSNVWHEPFWRVARDDLDVLTIKLKENMLIADYDIEHFIFNHDFAKALWGDTPFHEDAGKTTLKNWGYHLQQMVIADEPVQYIGANI